MSSNDTPFELPSSLKPRSLKEQIANARRGEKVITPIAELDAFVSKIRGVPPSIEAPMADDEQAAPENKPRKRDARAAAPKKQKQASERLTISVRADDMAKLQAFSERNLTSPTLMVRRIVEQWIEEHDDLFRK